MQTLLKSSTLKILIYMYNITVKVLNVNKFFKNFINEFYKKKYKYSNIKKIILDIK